MNGADVQLKQSIPGRQAQNMGHQVANVVQLAHPLSKGFLQPLASSMALLLQ